MIVNATYDSLDAIPEKFEGSIRDEFHQVNGKWVLKDDAVPGVGPLFNAGLYANEQRALTQYKTTKTRADNLETEVGQLKDRLAISDQPGTVILSPQDAKIWEKYQKLGTPNEVEKKLNELPTLQEKVTRFETETAMSKLVEQVQLNSEVLSDIIATSPNKLEVFVKEVDAIDAKGNAVKVPTAYVKVESTVDGKAFLEEKELIPYVKETQPQWKAEALIAAKVDEKGKPVTKPAAPVTKPPAGVRLPNLGSTNQTVAKTEEAERPVDRFNKRRESQPNPFTSKTPIIGQTAGMPEQLK